MTARVAAPVAGQAQEAARADATGDKPVLLRFEIRVALRTQSELDPIEAWLKLNAKGSWKMEFQGMSKAREGGSPARLQVVYRFADEEDAGRFQRERTGIPVPAPASKDVSAVAKVSRSISEVFVPARKPAPARAPPRPSAKPPVEVPGDPHNFVRRAGDLVRNADQVMASKVQLIGLARLKEHFGDTWSRVADRADQVAERAIQKNLGAHDMVTKVHDLNYLVLFAGVSQEEAQLRCRMISNDIAKQLIGDDGSGDLLSVKTGVVPIEGDTLFEETPSLDELVSHLAGALADKEEPSGGDAVAAEADAEPAWDSLDPLAGVGCVYRPMWDVRRRVVTSYLSLPSLRSRGGRLSYGESGIHGIETEEVQWALDSLILKRATADLGAVFESGKKLLITIPVHFETISTTARRIEYLAGCRLLPPMAAKLMVFEIVGAPEGVPQNRVLELTTALRARARAVLLRTSLSSLTARNWSGLVQAGITAVGADLSHEMASETALVERFVKYVDAADKQKLGSYLHGLRSLSLTVSAVGAGFHHLSGLPIESLADAPADAHHYNLADLYGAMAARP